VVFVLFAKDPPGRPEPKRLTAYMSVLGRADAWWLMLLYSVTFGGFVGLSSSLTIYFNAEYGLDAVTAGFFTAACVFAGSMLRPVGGFVGDRIGGVPTLMAVYLAAAVGLLAASVQVPSAFMALAIIFCTMGVLGMGNGAVFQIAPQLFGREIGVITGLVGMTGGIGGFYLASSLGLSKQMTGSYQAGFVVFALLALVAFGALLALRTRWTPATRFAAAAAE
jgi:NNP family nitrate/nitrite transporter-like MFS transporter